MSEPEKLRALLDKRGVKYETELVGQGTLFTVWADEERAYHILVRHVGIDIWSNHLTAQQAVDATLGREPHPYQMAVRGDGGTWAEVMKDALDDLAAAAAESCAPDEMREFMEHAAALGRGECELSEANWDDGQCTWGVICSACGARHEHTHGYGWNFAPCCGKAVKR